MKIAVGGKAFKSTHNIWKQWPVDVYTNDARELPAYANGVLRIKNRIDLSFKKDLGF